MDQSLAARSHGTVIRSPHDYPLCRRSQRRIQHFRSVNGPVDSRAEVLPARPSIGRASQVRGP